MDTHLPPAAPSLAATPTTSAGEITRSSATPTASSRRRRGGWLVGVVAVSLLSATLASAGTVALLSGASGGNAPASAAGSAGPVGTTAAVTRTISGTDAVVAVADSASPAVVTITVDSAATRGFGPFAVPATGIGSGFVFDAAGLILTNDHVVDGGTTITVAFQDGTELPGTVVASDPAKDLAVVHVDAAGLPTIPAGSSDALRVGQLVVAIGSPLGTFSESVTSGILSATGRTIDVGSATSRQTTTMTGLLQTDAAINEGNSGGPLLDAGGAVIGINVAVATSAQGIGFAVPIDAAIAIMAQARALVTSA